MSDFIESPDTEERDAAAELGRAFDELTSAILDAFGEVVAMIQKLADFIVDVFAKTVQFFRYAVAALLDAVLLAYCNDPKHWHYYKHAGRLRTRKKYRNLLMKSARKGVE